MREKSWHNRPHICLFIFALGHFAPNHWQAGIDRSFTYEQTLLRPLRPASRRDVSMRHRATVARHLRVSLAISRCHYVVISCFFYISCTTRMTGCWSLEGVFVYSSSRGRYGINLSSITTTISKKTWRACFLLLACLQANRIAHTELCTRTKLWCSRRRFPM